MADALTPYLPSLLWCIPLLPLLAAAVIAFLPEVRGRVASKIAIIALGLACLISLLAAACTLSPTGDGSFRLATAAT